MKQYLIPIIISSMLVSGLLLGCNSDKTYIYTQGTIVVRGDGEPIELINNPADTNPTYAELLAFIKKDQTDKYSYIFGPPKVAYTCGDFAEDVHNNAEAVGIRAAWVGIDIYGSTEGHALNAFETTDMGLVFIDCTGEGLWSESSSNRNSWDRQAYVKVGKAYAVIDIDSPKSGIEFLVSIEGHVKESYSERKPEIIEWLRTHDIKVLGQRWMQEWIREHEVELSRCGRVLEPFGIYGASSFMGQGHYYVGHGWVVRTDCMIEIPWFQHRLEVIDVDGMPVSWGVSLADYHNSEPLGIVKDIHLHW